MTGVIDLGEYLRILISRWMLVALVTLAGVVAGIVLALQLPVRYSSSATLLVRPAPANLSVTAQDVSAGLNPVLNSAVVPDVAPRTLAYLSRSSNVEEAVRKRLGDALPAELRRPGALLALIKVDEVGGRPNAIGVTATYSRAGDAKEIANAWAEESVTYLNSLVGTGYFDVQRSGAELQAAQAQLDKAQGDLTAYEKTSNVPALSSQLAARASLLADYERQSNQIQLNLSNAAALRAQLQQGRGGAASGLPIMLLALSSFTTQATGADVAGSLLRRSSSAPAGSEPAQPAPPPAQPATPAQSGTVIVQPTVDALSALSPAEQGAFLDSMMTVLKARSTDLAAQIAALEAAVADLRSQLEAANAQRDRLVAARDVSRATYSSLLGLIQQQQVSSRLQSEKVVLADSSARAVRAGTTRTVFPVLGLIVGLLAGILLAFLAEFARSAARLRAEARTGAS